MGAPKGTPPPHRCSHALCLRRGCVMPATCVLQREDDKGDKGDDGSGTLTPPRGQLGRVGRQRREGAGRTTGPCPKGARAVQAPTGGPPGCDRRKGRVKTGATRKPPPLQRDKCRTLCLRRACDVLTPGEGRRGRPPPLPPSPPPTQERGEDSEETARGHGGGQRTDRNAGGRDEKRAVKKKTKDTNTPEQGQTAGADGTWREPGSTARGAGKGDAPGDES